MRTVNDKACTPTGRTRVRCGHERAVFDRAVINDILVSTPLCNVAYPLDGEPALTPTLHWRQGDRIFWHGSCASRTLRRSADAQVCLNVTLLDGFVLARSAFHHLVNCRPVTIFGVATMISDDRETAEALEAMVERIIPGRWPHLRAMTATEFKATSVMWMRIDEVSAKVRGGGTVDDEKDYGLDIWAGVVPVAPRLGAPVDDERLKPD